LDRMWGVLTAVRPGGGVRAGVRSFIPQAKPRPPAPVVAEAAGASAGAAAAATTAAVGVTAAALPAVGGLRLAERWTKFWIRRKDFWVGLGTDYREALLDFRTDAAARPVRSLLLGERAAVGTRLTAPNPQVL
jgi:hypothetical protein